MYSLLKVLSGLIIVGMSIGLYAQQKLLPIYSDPMVFLDSLGRVVGELPKGYVILNTLDGKHDKGFVRGLAGNEVPRDALIPAKNIKTGSVKFFDQTGRFVEKLSPNLKSISPNINGFHILKELIKGDGYLRFSRYSYLNVMGTDQFGAFFQEAKPFNEGVAAVKQRQWFYIDESGKKLDILDQEFAGRTDVSSFYNGLSKIDIYKGKFQKRSSFGFVFIDKSGNRVLNTEDVFPDEHIARMGVMSDSISRVEFLSEKGYSVFKNVAYVNTKGEVIARYDSLTVAKDFVDGFAPILIHTRRKDNRYGHKDGFIINTKGEEIRFADNSRVVKLHHVYSHYYWVLLENKLDSLTYSGVFNADEKRFVYETSDDIMGMQWDLISLRNSQSKRYYVVNYKTGELVYDTEVSSRIFYNLDDALANKDKVTKYICSDGKDIARLGELKALEELSISNVDLRRFPDNFNFPKLKVLKLDGLRNIEVLPSHLKTLTKLSIRDCTKANNLMEMISGQKYLKELNVINFGVEEWTKRQIANMYPNVKLNIRGSKRNADSELQEAIEGF